MVDPALYTAPTVCQKELVAGAAATVLPDCVVVNALDEAPARLWLEIPLSKSAGLKTGTKL